MTSSDIAVRRAHEHEIDDIVAMASVALGWAPGEPHTEFFRWKHLESPFGVSPMWVAEADGELAGFRTFMRWQLADSSGRRLRAVRAVDTATHPDFQRRGIFSRLTTAAVDEMAGEGVDIVFNTPNEQSRPGYLKMGWIEVGRLAVAMRPTSVTSLWRMLRARTAAEKWSEPSPAGVPALEALAQPGIDELLASQPQPDGLATPLTEAFLQWRYGFEPLHYRAWMPGRAADGIEDGMVLFRVRRRGSARECSVGSVLAPGGDRAGERRLLSGLTKAVDADYLLRMGPSDLRAGFAPMPNQGPRLTAREVTTTPDPDLAHWHLTLGDIELF